MSISTKNDSGRPVEVNPFDELLKRFEATWLLSLSARSFFVRLLQVCHFSVYFLTIKIVFGEALVPLQVASAVLIVVFVEVSFGVSVGLVKSAFTTAKEVRSFVLDWFANMTRWLFDSAESNSQFASKLLSTLPWDIPLSPEYERLAKKIGLISRLYINRNIHFFETGGRVPEPSEVFEKLEKFHSVFFDFVDTRQWNDELGFSPKVTTFPSKIGKWDCFREETAKSTMDSILEPGLNPCDFDPKTDGFGLDNKAITWLRGGDLNIPVLRDDPRYVWLKDADSNVPFSLNVENLLRHYGEKASIFGAKSDRNTLSVMFYIEDLNSFSREGEGKTIANPERMLMRINELALADYSFELGSRISASSPSFSRVFNMLFRPRDVSNWKSVLRKRERIIKEVGTTTVFTVPDFEDGIVSLEFEKPNLRFDEVRLRNGFISLDVGAESDDDLAPFSMRFSAGLFDLIVGAFASMLLLSPLAFTGSNWFSTAGLITFAATWAIILFIYMTSSVGFFGKTMGMRLFSLELVDAVENEYPTLHQAAVNSSVFILSLFLAGLGFLTVFFNADRRALHDLLSGTIQVKEF